MAIKHRQSDRNALNTLVTLNSSFSFTIWHGSIVMLTYFAYDSCSIYISQYFLQLHVYIVCVRSLVYRIFLVIFFSICYFFRCYSQTLTCILSGKFAIPSRRMRFGMYRFHLIYFMKFHGNRVIALSWYVIRCNVK